MFYFLLSVCILNVYLDIMGVFGWDSATRFTSRKLKSEPKGYQPDVDSRNAADSASANRKLVPSLISLRCVRTENMKITHHAKLTGSLLFFPLHPSFVLPLLSFFRWLPPWNEELRLGFSSPAYSGSLRRRSGRESIPPRARRSFSSAGAERRSTWQQDPAPSQPLPS